MNALLKFQAQQEDQFLQSILAHDFEQLCAEHVDFFQNNLQSKHPANTALPSDPISLNLVPT